MISHHRNNTMNVWLLNIIGISSWIMLSVLMVMGSTVQSQPLPIALWESALQKNPRLESYRQKLKTREAMMRSLGEWPGLELEAGVLNRPMELLMGDQRFSFTAMQMIPRYRLFNLERRELSFMKMADQAILDEAALMIRKELSMAWIERVTLEQEMVLMDQSIALVKQMKEVVEAKIKTGQSSSDWLRLDIRLLEMEDDHVAMDDKIEAIDYRIWNLIGDSLRNPIPVVDSLVYTPFDLPTAVPDFSKHPSVQMLQSEVEAARVRADMSSQMARPMLGVGLQYIPLRQRSLMETKTDGKDMVMPMLRVSIPLSRSAIRASTEASTSESIGFEWDANNRISELEIEWNSILSDIRIARRNIVTARQQELLTRQLFENTKRDYESGMGSIEMLIEMQDMLLMYRMNALEATMRHQMSLARLEELQPGMFRN
jgi:outer membrane protein TolC